MALLPNSIEDYVGEADTVRACDAFIEALDLEEFGIKINSRKVGNAEIIRIRIFLICVGFKQYQLSHRQT